MVSINSAYVLSDKKINSAIEDILSGKITNLLALVRVNPYDYKEIVHAVYILTTETGSFLDTGDKK